MPGFYKGLDLAVMPSWNEGLPLTILEAMSCGVPVVATDVGGVREMVRDGTDGIIVPARRPDLLAQSIAALLGDGSRRSSMGRSARERILERFTLHAFSEQILAVYADAISSSGVTRNGGSG